MKVLVVDDEPLAVMRLKKMLQINGVVGVLTAKNGQKAIESVELHHPHVVFLDIEMPVLTGIQAAPLIKKISPETHVIFCTAYADFAIQAFDLSASDYLLKPVTQERLKQALDKVSEGLFVATYCYHQGNQLLSLPLDEIYCFVSEEKSTLMHCSQGIVIVDESLVLLEKRFSNQLLRINRNALINTAELIGVHRDKLGGYAILKNTEYRPQISRRKIPSIKELLK